MQRKGRKHRLEAFLRDTDPKHLRCGILIAVCAVFVIVFMLTMNSEPQLLSSEEIVAVKERGVLTVGVLDDGDSMEHQLGILLADKILPELSNGSGAGFFTVTSTSVSAHISDDSIDVAIALMRKGEDPTLAYSEPYYTDTINLAVRNGDKNKSLAGKTIGYVFEGKKMNVPEEFEQYAKKNNAQLKAYAGYPDMLGALLSAKIDAAVMYGVYAEKYASKYAFELSPTILGYAEYAIAAAADKPAFVEIANIMLKELKENGELYSMLPKKKQNIT